ncbi:uncharacterized protein EV154DRAFT_603009 [Mucor mucedo]|uniref:uncharacterized protein n=1 Tax=Mucor mucedo TaxID=29922 RepID=UPI00221F0C44|nr:uncharacterized protein EV154DRAFT_603009 [Mucor mucedo]KAI7890871.1 hypothetical protein EV154DRAFT_603009 [Mucor mucedo]
MQSVEARDDVFEIDGITLGTEKSVGSSLKSKAVHLAKNARTFTNLTDEAKNTVFLGLNSIVDLSNNSTDPDSQRSLFSETSWQQLKNLVYESRDMPPLPDDVTNELKDIEKIAQTDLKRAYQLCLKAQARYAVTLNESFFEIYAHVIRLLNKKNSILQTDRGKKATEKDFVNEAWSLILTVII